MEKRICVHHHPACPQAPAVALSCRGHIGQQVAVPMPRDSIDSVLPGDFTAKLFGQAKSVALARNQVLFRAGDPIAAIARITGAGVQRMLRDAHFRDVHLRAAKLGRGRAMTSRAESINASRASSPRCRR